MNHDIEYHGQKKKDIIDFYNSWQDDIAIDYDDVDKVVERVIHNGMCETCDIEEVVLSIYLLEDKDSAFYHPDAMAININVAMKDILNWVACGKPTISKEVYVNDDMKKLLKDSSLMHDFPYAEWISMETDAHAVNDNTSPEYDIYIEWGGCFDDDEYHCHSIYVGQEKNKEYMEVLRQFL